MNKAQSDLPEPEQFAETAVRAMVGRKWSWLSETTGINVGTLKYQLLTNPDALKLGSAKRIATALGLSVWAEVA